MMLPQGQFLNRLIQPRHLEMLGKLWPDHPMVPPLLAYKPWAAFIIAAASSLNGSPGVEPSLVLKASEDHKHVHCLENGADFCMGMDSIPMYTLSAAIDHYARSAATAKDNFIRMHRAWVENDSGALWDLLLQGPFASDPVLHSTMFASRNRLWTP